MSQSVGLVKTILAGSALWTIGCQLSMLDEPVGKAGERPFYAGQANGLTLTPFACSSFLEKLTTEGTFSDEFLVKYTRLPTVCLIVRKMVP